MQVITKPCCPDCARTGKRCGSRNLKGLGFDISSFMPLATSLFGGGSSGSPGGGVPGTAVVTTVSPNIAVSPQISPIFQQQFQPSNSPISAGTSQTMPGGGAGFAPGVDTTAGAPSVPSVQGAPMDWNKMIMYGGIGVLALLGIKLMKGKKTPARRHVRYRQHALRR